MDVSRASRAGYSRKRMRARKDRRVFTKTTSRTRKENFLSQAVMRGGIRF